MHLNTRSSIKLGNDEVENEDNDFVELEKSNVLLMGLTGSGIYLVSFFFIRVLVQGGLRAGKHECDSRPPHPHRTHLNVAFDAPIHPFFSFSFFSIHVDLGQNWLIRSNSS